MRVRRPPRRDSAAARAPERVSGAGQHALHDVARFAISRAARARVFACELFGDALSLTVEHLIGPLSVEGPVRELGIVRLDVECDEPSEGLDAVQLRYSHWCLSVRHQASIREFEKLTSRNAGTRRNNPETMILSMPALTFSTPASATSVGASSALTAPRAAARRIATVEANSNFSATDQAKISRVIVDDGVQVDLRAIDELDDRRVDVPHLVKWASPEAVFRRCRVDAGMEPAPALAAGQLVPGCRGGEHFVETLGEDSEPTSGHVPVFR